MQIAKPARSPYELAPGPIREVIDYGCARMVEAANWKVRKKAMLDLVAEFRMLYTLLTFDRKKREKFSEALRDALGEAVFERLMREVARSDDSPRDVPGEDQRRQAGDDDLRPRAAAAADAPAGLAESGQGAEADRPVEPDDLADADAEEDEDDEGSVGFDSVLQAFIGGVLERLDEREITTVDQAAIYFLSGVPEHQEAAVDWLSADPKRRRAYRKLVRSDRRYAQLLRKVEESHRLPNETDAP